MVRCSVAQLEDFKGTLLYQDLVDELDAWIEARRDDLEDPEFSMVPDQLYRLQGAIKALRDVKDSLIDVLIGLAGEQKG